MNPVRDLPSPATVVSPVGRVRTRDRASDRVYDELASGIREMRILPGASLSETDLAEQLHVSRTPLREAISRLAETGLVVVVPQVGTRVELIRLHDVEQACFVRENLEAAAGAKVCAMPDRDVTRLRLLLAEQKRCAKVGDPDGFFAADEALHEEIFRLSGYPGAWRMMHSITMHLDRIRRLSLPDPKTLRALIAEHEAIVDALAEGDAETAREVIVRHTRRASDEAPGLQQRHPEYFAE